MVANIYLQRLLNTTTIEPNYEIVPEKDDRTNKKKFDL
jgi:hypothetical protein